MEEIKQGNGQFFIGEEANPDAEITFEESGSHTYTITHTAVSDKLKNQGVGSQLVKRVVDYARQNDKQIDPVCSFARKKFEETPSYHDVWKVK
ncbi:hypothetical protein GCM10007216_34850 [Thalassobacillus devorans]|uniref:N-acetyltransferase domain-containing protein n=1 Tax=Thalassobacillus devorans TaxID=279813 RepID=A0ABQ1PQR2_9BACI|nr:GNAT family N-acetyltransferase [Thalassobacillus devorans]NIK30326.1 hypothetical protein [Thalassobacillus devorans]GGD01183.1 hypothetical protein GCM10007216_34850 [Thalassobacillus devorans]